MDNVSENKANFFLENLTTKNKTPGLQYLVLKMENPGLNMQKALQILKQVLR
jgi:hypothetical protein